MAAAQTTGSTDRRSKTFLLLYALAHAGGAIAYTPFLMLVLPTRVSQLAGAADVIWLGYIIFAGALAASAGGIFAGWISDRTHNRRAWVAGGLASTTLLLVTMARCETITSLLCTVVAWQVALNFMLVPLIAWAGDLIPDGQRGTLGGLMSVGPLLAALSGMILPAPGTGTIDGQLAVIAAMAAALMLPWLVFGRDACNQWKQTGSLRLAPSPARIAPATLNMWLARLLIQLSGAALAAYLFYWLRELDPAMQNGAKASLFASGLVTSVVAALSLGRWIDRHGHGLRILALLAMVASASLTTMAIATTAAAAKLAFVLFTAANATFLALHGGQVLTVLPDDGTRARGIGIFNITNTAPSLIMPWIAITLVPGSGFGGLFFVLGLLALLAALLLALISPAL